MENVLALQRFESEEIGFCFSFQSVRETVREQISNEQVRQP